MAEEQSPSQRVTIELPKGRDNLFLDTGVYHEATEDHVREMMGRIHFYADEHGSGNQKTFDVTGRYLCGGENQETEYSCNKFRPDPGGSPVGGCTMFTGDINGVTGGCDFWETFRGLLDPELKYARLLDRDGVYVEHRDGEGFSCFRCIFGAMLAVRPDSSGRNRFCRWFGVRVTDRACCNRHERYPVIVFKDNQAVLVEGNALTEWPS